MPDNTRTVTTKCSYYEPELNPTHADMASYYNTAVVPARIARPKDKTKVEGHVLITSPSILAPLGNRRFFSLADMREAIFGLLDDVNTKLFQKLPGFRPSAFLDIEKPALRPLPEKQYGLAYFTKAKVNLDCHLEIGER